MLLHELAHVRRGDLRVQALAQVACTAYWFNPLTGWPPRIFDPNENVLVTTRFSALARDHRSYAPHLLEIAKGLQTISAARGALAMSRPIELEGRLMAVLSDT